MGGRRGPATRHWDDRCTRLAPCRTGLKDGIGGFVGSAGLQVRVGCPYVAVPPVSAPLARRSTYWRPFAGCSLMGEREFTADDAWSFNGGTHTAAHEVLGAHPGIGGSVAFRVWAPNALAVHVVGDMNNWAPSQASALAPDPSGVWRGDVLAEVGQRYKFRITPSNGAAFDKSDPFAFATEEPPRTASVIADRAFGWIGRRLADAISTGRAA